MTDDLETAKRYLKEHDMSVVFVRDKEIFSSAERGVRPLLEFLDSGVSFEGFSASDKVVGRGAALLHVMLKTKALYAEVLSESAEEVLKHYGVSYEFATKVTHISNRNRDGICPIEQATEGIFDLNQASSAIRKRLAELHST